MESKPLYRSKFNGIIDFLVVIPIILAVIVISLIARFFLGDHASFISGVPLVEYLIYQTFIILVIIFWFAMIKQDEIEVHEDKVVICKRRRMAYRAHERRLIIPINRDFHFTLYDNRITFITEKALEEFNVTLPTRRKKRELVRIESELMKVMKKRHLGPYR